MSKPLTFGELSVGDFFIDFPIDGDDNGHGGYRKGLYVFEKIRSLPSKRRDIPNNAIRMVDGCKSHLPDVMQVCKIVLF